MAKCLHCKKEIDGLLRTTSIRSVHRVFLMDKKNGLESSWKDDYPADDGEDRYECPECHHLICKTENEAILFLGGTPYGEDDKG